MSTIEELEKQVEELKLIRQNLLDFCDKKIAIEYRLENTLEWIRFLAGMHYMGGAFEPEHMRAISNMAADALQYEFKSGTEFVDEGRFLPDFEESTEKAMEQARKRAQKFHSAIDKFQRPLRKKEDTDDGEQVR